MVYFKASFYYVRYQVMFRIIGLTYRYFKIRVWLLSVLFTTLYMAHQILSIFYRLLDEVFHRGYKRQAVQQPVFIIANPRSGTTYLHRLLAMDSQRFIYTKNAHTFFMSSSFVQFYMVIRWVDRTLLFGLIRKIVNRLDEVFWGGWDEIHKMGFNKAEEDELVFAQTFNSPGMFIPFPYFHLHNFSRFLDNETETVKRNVMDFYESSVKRFVYRMGPSQTYLAKNVMSTGRYKTLLSRFPDAKLIYIARHPYEAIPSMASMFTAMYRYHSPDVPSHHPSRQIWVEYAMDMYRYGSGMKKYVPASQYYGIRFDELMSDPKQTVLNLYNHFGWTVSEEFLKLLDEEAIRAKSYKSSHTYSLEEYGISKEFLYHELEDVMRDYGFKEKVEE